MPGKFQTRGDDGNLSCMTRFLSSLHQTLRIRAYGALVTHTILITYLVYLCTSLMTTRSTTAGLQREGGERESNSIYVSLACSTIYKQSRLIKIRFLRLLAVHRHPTKSAVDLLVPRPSCVLILSVSPCSSPFNPISGQFLAPHEKYLISNKVHVSSIFRPHFTLITCQFPDQLSTYTHCMQKSA